MGDSERELRAFLEKHVEGMPAGAPNFLCWFVEAPRIYESYERHCREVGVVAAGKVEFTAALVELFPMALLRDVRGERHFTNVRFHPPHKVFKRVRAPQNLTPDE